MLRTMLKSKIHRATVTQADLHYVGSVTIDADLMDAADLLDSSATAPSTRAISSNSSIRRSNRASVSRVSMSPRRRQVASSIRQAAAVEPADSRKRRPRKLESAQIGRFVTARTMQTKAHAHSDPHLVGR